MNPRAAAWYKSTADILRIYQDVAGPIIARHYIPNCCIAATSITIAVLTPFGLKPEPFPCKATIFNKAFVNRIAAEGRWPTQEETHQWCATAGCWSVGIGYPGPGLTGYIGHLCTVAGGYLIDASIGQASRPAKNLILPPVLFAQAPRLFRRNQRKLTVFTPEGCAITYEPDRANTGYKDSPDWTNQERHKTAVSEIMYAMGGATVESWRRDGPPEGIHLP